MGNGDDGPLRVRIRVSNGDDKPWKRWTLRLAAIIAIGGPLFASGLFLPGSRTLYYCAPADALVDTAWVELPGFILISGLVWLVATVVLGVSVLKRLWRWLGLPRGRDSL